ncbi:ankyrin repeat-containing domain protein [Cadophora sp. MPI-SDFR-AT-0126]|nr:ankyrin repeat-containing domain protein [Leotiomycetes sp. MPI-SDFR-AT-0126]
MAEPANFTTLPTEVLLLINSNLSGTGDINAICQLTRRLYHLFLPEIFERHLAWAKTTDRPKKERDCLIAIFLHSVKYNSSNLIQQLFCYRDIVDFRGYLPSMPFSHHSITYLHFAVSMDAPVIASRLMKHGSSSDFSIDSLSVTYPDLTPLYMALARPQLLTQHELNAALRIACSYALPRTTSFLLARGADARAVSIYGISVLHATLARRARWRFFDEFYAYMEPAVPPSTLWEDLIWATTKSLVNYGADPKLKTDNSRAHCCDTRCWKSVNCENSQQTPAHLAAASGSVSVLRSLVKRVGLNVLEEKDGGGYTPLYGAMVQGHDEASKYILRQHPHIPNPMVRIDDKSTALHIASRFALEQIVTYILEHGATDDINREDAKGRTPLHEILSQDNIEREHEIVGTLHVLAKFGADPDHGFAPGSSFNSSGLSIGQKKIETPRQMARKHAFASVRDMFRLEEENIYRDWCEEAKEESAMLVANATSWANDENTTPEDTQAAVVPGKPKKRSKKQRERAAVKEREQNFPALVGCGGATTEIEKIPPSLYMESHKSRRLTEWEQHQVLKIQMKELVDSSELQPLSTGMGRDSSGCDIPVKAKGRSGKNKWKKMAF